MLSRHQSLRIAKRNTQGWQCWATQSLFIRSNAGLANAPRGKGRHLVCRVLSHNNNTASATAERQSGQRSREGSRARPSSPADDLNARQREAALTTAQVARVKAGPGSGKTRVVVARAHHLITSCGVDPRRILAITFTNKAARELRERLEAALGPGDGSGSGSGSGSGKAGREGTQRRSRPAVLGQVLAKTFHGLGAHILRRSLKLKPSLVSELGLDADFKVLDASQSWRALKDAVREVEKREAKAESAAGSYTVYGKEGTRREALSPLGARELSTLVDVLSGLIAASKTDLAAAGHPDDATAMVSGPPAVQDRVLHLKGKPLSERLFPEMVQMYFMEYQSQLRRNNAVDFADLICLPVRLLDRDQQLGNSWRNMFDHILVDEFQDTDPAQYKLVRLLLAQSTGLFVVGDPDQAIYAWRGAEVAHMSTYLTRDYPTTATHHLHINYRSVPEIVNCAEAVLQYGSAPPPDMYERQVAARPPPSATAAIRINVYPTPEAEAKAVVRMIVGGGSGGDGGGGGGGGRALSGLDRIAVLYRRRDQSRPIEEALTRSGVPYIVVGGQPFWEYKEVADTVAYLHWLRDPLRSDVLLERIINDPKRGLGPTTVNSLREAARANGVSLGELLFGDCCGADSASAPSAAPLPPPAAGGREEVAAYAPGIPVGSPLAAVKLKKPALKGVQELRGLMCRLRALAAAGATVERLVGAALALSGYETALRERRDGDGGGDDGGGGGGRRTSSGRSKSDEAEEAGERLERLQTLCELAARPEAWLAAEDAEEEEAGCSGSGPGDVAQQQQRPAAVGLPGLSRFLEHAALVTGADTDPKDERGAVRLMTLHASKGLEFQWVFILGLEDGILPSFRSDDKDEERRLFYVGITRAEDRLFLSRCEERFQYDGRRPSQPSPFLRAVGW